VLPGQLLGGLTTLGITIWPVANGSARPGEAAVFRWVHDLPDWLHPPTWVLMQLGTLGAVPVTAGIALLASDRGLAARLVASGGSAYPAGQSGQATGPPRPAEVLTGVHIRGDPAGGHGYLSGHDPVAAPLAAAARGTLPRPAGRAALVAAPLVGLARIYVGAHLPWDVVEGLGLGWTVDALVTAVLPRRC